MAVKMMVNADRAGEPNVERIDNYPGYDGPMYIETSYAGCVLALREMNGYDDSDFYASVWDEAAGEIKEVEYATTRGWTYPNGASIDATKEVREKAARWEADYVFKMWKVSNEEQAKAVAVGKRVEVVRGRKLAHGLLGNVFWAGYNKFARSRKPDRAGVRFDDGSSAYTAISNLAVVDWEQYMKSDEDGLAYCEAVAGRRYGVDLSKVAV